MAMHRNLLAYDLGASSGRAILGRFDGKVLTLEELHRFSNDPVMVSGHFRWDILRLFFEMKQGLFAAARQGVTLDSAGIDTWGVDFGLLDKHDQLLSNPYHYRDVLTEGMMEKAYDVMPKDEIFKRTGLAFMRFNTLYQLHALKCMQSTALEAAKSLLFVPDLLNFFFTGEKGTEYTIASTGQLVDPVARDWAWDVIDRFGIKRSLFAPMQQPGAIRGHLLADIAEETGVKAMPFVAVASHDTASAVAAVPAEGNDFAYLSSGTWSLLGAEVRHPRLSERVMQANYTNEGGVCGTTRLLRNFAGLWIIQECKRDWDRKGENVEFADLVIKAEKAQPFIAMIDPDDEAFMAPGSMPARIQQYCQKTGQQVPQTQGEIARVVFESLALTYRWGVEQLEAIMGRPIRALHIVGGGSKNMLLNTFTANAIGRPVIAGPSEATAIGTLLVQAMALGEISGMDELRAVVRASFPGETLMPEDGAVWDDAYGRFCSLFAKDA